MLLVCFARLALVWKGVFGEDRVSLHFGDQKINLDPTGWNYEPNASASIVGTGGLCFIVSEPVEALQIQLVQPGFEIIGGIVLRTGPTGCLRSIYLRDPNRNLIELSNGEE